MDFFQLLILAVVQGLTEFLPISSSAHLILAPLLFGWEDQGLAFDLATHLGSLFAVMLYFRNDIARMIVSWFGSLRGQHDQDSKLAWCVILGTIPVCIGGLLLKDLIETSLRDPLVIAAATLVFGLLLWWADVAGKRVRDEHSVGWRDALLIGIGQMFALIPGASRSGVTMTAGLLLGLTREAAARFSFLLSIPVILLGSMLVSLDLVSSGNAVDWVGLALATGLSFVAAYACIAIFLQLINRIGMLPFVLYRIVLAVLLFVLFWPA